ncbi:MAG: alanine dehydrogenase [Erysipelothrix sp.]|nr:alanine dehydrogenase [Erysipelothrix sp.]
MKIGSVKEIKPFENRVGLTPAHAYEYIMAGHEVFVESMCGDGSGYSDHDYEDVGVKVFKSAKDVWNAVDFMLKVKEPLEEEYDLLKEDQILFTYLHLASNPKLAQALKLKRVKAVSYETVEDEFGRLPLLKPMSEVAGRLAIQEGSKYLEKQYGGKGILLSGVPGVRGGNVVIIGSGVVGMNACKTALGMGANVTVLGRDLSRLDYFSDVFNGQIQTIFSDRINIERELKSADLVVCSVLVPGGKTPKLIQRKHLSMMQKGTVIVDVAIDQGGCCETSRPTTHDDPIYEVDGIIHYCVGNMPGAVPMTATQALSNATLHYGMMIANLGLEEAIATSSSIAKGLNVYKGAIVHPQVAEALGEDFVSYENLV